MSYPISQNIKPNQPAMGFNTPQLQDVDAEKIKQSVNNTIESQNNIVTQASEHEDPLPVYGLTVPIWFGLSKLMEKFNKNCATRADGRKNLLEHVRDFGDKIGHRFEGENFKKVAEVGKKVNTSLKTFIEKVPILNAFFNTPAKPKNTMATMMKGGTLNETAQDAKELIEGFIKNVDGKTYNEINLKKLGLTVEEFEKINKAPHENIKRIIQICKDRAEVCKKNNIDDFIQLANVNTGAAPWAKNGMKKLIGEKAYTFLMGREVRWSESANKLEALKGLKGNYGKTAIGKILPKYFLRITEGLTNGTAGGKMAIAMQAYCFADAIIRTAKAKKGDKGKTFIESIVNDLSYYLLMPLGMGILYGLGGLKFIGVDKPGMEAYRKAVEEFNKNVDLGKFASKAEYKQAKTTLKNMLKGDTKLALKADGVGKTALKSITNVIHKPLKAFGRVITIGLDTLKKYNPNIKKPPGKIANKLGELIRINKQAIGGEAVKSFVDNFGYKFRTKIGILRAPLYLFFIAPPLVKLIVKGCHKIFGKPEKSLLDEDKEAKKEPPKIVYPTYPQQNEPIQPSSVMQPTKQPIQPSPEIQPVAKQEPIQPASVIQPTQQNTNLALNPIASNQKTMIPTEEKPTRRYIPSDEGVKILPEDSNKRTMIPTEDEPARRYIPSDDGVKLSKYDYAENDKINAVLNKADKTERKINDLLNK